MSTTEIFSASAWFIHFDGLCNYLHLFEKQPATNFFKNNCYFPDQEHISHYTNKFTETEIEFSPNIFSGSFNASFAAANAFLVIFIISTNGNSSSSSSGGGSDSDSNSASSCVSTKIWTWTSKYKSGAIVVARVAKYNLETSAKKRIVFGQGR